MSEEHTYLTEVPEPAEPAARFSESAPLRIGVILPCCNEQGAIGEVIGGFVRALPEATIYVYDNNSTDQTGEQAEQAGAVVRQETRQGKGHVVRRMFADVDADIYVMADGDLTYDANSARQMVDLLVDEGLDMVVGTRMNTEGEALFRRGHRFGNWILTGLVTRLFGKSFTDILSGYRVFSRRFVKSFPALSTGFETETELTVHALELNMPVGEMRTRYAARAEGTESKLSTYKDGLRILRTILYMLKERRPLLFYGVIAFGLIAVALGLAFPLLVEYLETGLVPRLPTAVLATGLTLLGFLSL